MTNVFRLHLAKIMKTGGNLLLLDEPTNDLDVDTLRALEDAIEDFAGSSCGRCSSLGQVLLKSCLADDDNEAHNVVCIQVVQ